MKEINTYIIEKLKINKDSKLVKNRDTEVAIITDICGIYLDRHKNLVNAIEEWLNEQDITDIFKEVKIYWDKKTTYKKAHFINRILQGEWEKHLIDDPRFCYNVANSVKIPWAVDENDWEIYVSREYNSSLLFIKHFDNTNDKIMYVFKPVKNETDK